jgi:hypothetical protein
MTAVEDLKRVADTLTEPEAALLLHLIRTVLPFLYPLDVPTPTVDDLAGDHFAESGEDVDPTGFTDQF